MNLKITFAPGVLHPPKMKITRVRVKELGGPGESATPPTRGDTRSTTPPRTEVTRQLLRALGFSQIIAKLSARFTTMPRRDLRDLARALQREAWDGRDLAAVERLKKVTRAQAHHDEGPKADD